MPDLDLSAESVPVPHNSNHEALSSTVQLKTTINNSMATSNFPDILPPAPLDMKDTTDLLENWKVWKQMWENYAVIMELDKKEPKYQKLMVLHAIGADALRVINAFVYGDGEDGALIETLVTKLDDHIIGELNEIFERYIFNSRSQEDGETIDACIRHCPAYTGTDVQIL